MSFSYHKEAKCFLFLVNPVCTLTVPDVNIEKGYSGTVSFNLANDFDICLDS